MLREDLGPQRRRGERYTVKRKEAPARGVQKVSKVKGQALPAFMAAPN